MDVTQSSSNIVRSFRRIPGPFSLPLVGTLYLYKLGTFNVLKYHEVLQKLYETYGPLVREKMGSTTLIHVFDLDDAKAIHKNEGRMPYVVPLQETAQLYRQKADMSPGLGNVNGEEWYRLRAAVRQQMLKPQDVEQYLPAVRDVAKDLVNRLHEKRDENNLVPNFEIEIGKWSQESSGVVCFDKRLGYLSGWPSETVIERVIEANKKVFYLSGLLKFSFPVHKYIPTPKWKQLVAAEDIIVRTAKGYTEDALNTLDRLVQENQLTNDRFIFLQSLLARKELSKKDIVTITLSLFTDGLSTTVPTVLHNLYCLAANEEVQEKAYKEVQSVLGPDEDITPEHLNQILYIRAVVKETFRMYPNGTEISRILQNDHILSNYHVPAQTNVSINMGVHYRSDKYFSSPEQYQPERWLRGKGKENPDPYVVVPFGFGIRSCAGRRFAEQDIYVVLTTIIRHFKLQYVGKKPLELVYNTLLMPAMPLSIRFIPRKS